MSALRKIIPGGLILIAFALPSGHCQAQEIPELVELNTLSQLYDGVFFDHAGHMDYADCSVCHHHTTGTGMNDENCARCHSTSRATDLVACSECHPADRYAGETFRQTDTAEYHIDKPGLKGAYHLSCVECHGEMGGPTGCQDCHGRNEVGDDFFHLGAHAPEDASHH